MKILFLSDNFPPETNAPAIRTYEHCREWVQEGASVTVITCTPNFPYGKVYSGYKNKWRYRENMDGIEVVRVWSYMSPNKGMLKRTLDYLSFALSACMAGLLTQADVIIATSPQFFTALSGYFLAGFKGRPYILEVRDLWPESIVAVGALRNKRLIRWLERIELHLYRKADRIVVVTDGFKANMISRNIQEEKIDVFKNGICQYERESIVCDNGLLKKHAISNKFVVGYIGTHGMAHKLDFILRCAANTDQGIHFLFIGDGAEKSKLTALVKQMNLTNVTMLKAIPRSEVEKYLSVIDLALVPLRRSKTFKSVIPSKIFESAAMGKPILLGVEGESKEIVEKYGAGLAFNPEDKDDFLEKLYRLKNDADLYRRCQEGCRALAKAFDRRRIAREFLQAIQEVVGKGG